MNLIGKKSGGQQPPEIDEKSILQYAAENGMIDLSNVQRLVEMSKRKDFIEQHHPYSIWQGKDGKWYTYLPEEKKGRSLVKRKTQEEIEDIVIDYWEQDLENPTIKEVFEEWNDRRLDLEKISPATHLRNTQFFERHYTTFGNRRIKDVTEEEFVEFLENELAEKRLTAKAFAGLKSVTKYMLKRAKRRKLINFNVDEMLQALDISESDFRKVRKPDDEEVFNDEEMDTMMTYLEENPDVKNTGLLLLFVSGIRIGELVTLKHSDFNGDLTFNIRRTETRYLGKDGEYKTEVTDFPKTEAGWRTVVIPNEFKWLEKRLQEMNPDSEYIFLDRKKRRVTTAQVRKRLYYNCHKLGIKPKSPHKIRKTYGSILLDNNVNSKIIMDQMGHTDIRCTERHYHRNRKQIEEKISCISNIEEFKQPFSKSDITR